MWEEGTGKHEGCDERCLTVGGPPSTSSSCALRPSLLPSNDGAACTRDLKGREEGTFGHVLTTALSHQSTGLVVVYVYLMPFAGAPHAYAAEQCVLAQPLLLPSLHIFSSQDRLVSAEQSRQLSLQFEPSCRQKMEHELGQ